MTPENRQLALYTYRVKAMLLTDDIISHGLVGFPSSIHTDRTSTVHPCAHTHNEIGLK